jgi:hypothetical protein
MRRFKKWVRGNPVLVGVITVVFGAAPQWVSGTWALFSSEPLLVVISRQPWSAKLAYNVFSFATWPISFAMLALIWWTAWRQRVAVGVVAPAAGTEFSEPLVHPKRFEVVGPRQSDVVRPPRTAVVVTIFIAVLCLVAGWWAHGRLAKRSGVVAQPRITTSVTLADEWAPLTQTEIKEWVNRLSPLGIKQIDVFWSPEVEAKRLFLSLQDVGKRCGIPLYSMGNGTEPNTIKIMGRSDDSDALVVVQDLFKKKYPQSKVVVDTKSYASSEREIFISIGQKQQ